MTEEKIKQGQELLRAIKEIEDFSNVIEQVAKNPYSAASLTLTARSANSNPTLTLSNYPTIAIRLANIVTSVLNDLKEKFKEL